MAVPRLTFDDGPSEFTEALLDVLARHRVAATFFVVGESVVRRPELVWRIADAGHAIGNHSWDHPHLPELSDAELLDQLERTNDAIHDVLRVRPRLFRPPYGARDERIDKLAAELGMKTVLWDVDPRDWSLPGADQIASAIAGAQADDVVLLHDGRGDRRQTIEAVELALARPTA